MADEPSKPEIKDGHAAKADKIVGQMDTAAGKGAQVRTHARWREGDLEQHGGRK